MRFWSRKLHKKSQDHYLSNNSNFGSVRRVSEICNCQHRINVHYCIVGDIFCLGTPLPYPHLRLSHCIMGSNSSRSLDWYLISRVLGNCVIFYDKSIIFYYKYDGLFTCEFSISIVTQQWSIYCIQKVTVHLQVTVINKKSNSRDFLILWLKLKINLPIIM